VKPLQALLALFAFWLLPAIVATMGFSLVPSRLRPDMPLATTFLSQALVWLAWGGWSLLVFAVGRRFPFERGRIGAALAAHVPLSFVVIAGQIVLVNAVSRAFGLTELQGLESVLAVGVRVYGDLFFVVFWGIVGAHMGYRWYARWQEQAVRAARLDQDLAVSHLRALQSQLNPHFLFNALNSVVTLIGKDPAAAQDMVVRLADLLRATLGAGEAQEVPLARELEFTARYLDIERIRFGERLEVEWTIAHEGEPLVPAFGLQPLVENAIVHGIAQRVAGGKVAIGAARRGDTLMLTVVDSGVGPRGGAQRAGAGVGLANLRARLERLYGDAARLDFESDPTGFTRATLVVPWRENATAH
jgi:hypothetical protein